MTDPTHLDGPGCGQADHDDDCMCDVTLPTGPPAPAGNVPQALAELREIHGDAVASLAETLVNTELADRWSAELHANVNRWAGNGVVKELLHKGATLRETAGLLGAPLLDVLRCLTQRDEDRGLLLVVEEALRTAASEGDVKFGAVAREVGCTYDVVRNYAESLGIESSGDARRLSADTHAEIKRLREAGRPYRGIATDLGLHTTTVRRICQKNNWWPLAEVKAS